MPKKVTPKGKAAKPPKRARTARKTTPAAKKKAEVAEKPQNLTYIRNIRNTWARLTFNCNDRRIEFEPRGMRGDLAIVNEEERADDIYDLNIGVLFEPVSYEEGKRILTAQNTNVQRPPRPIEMLRNAKGEPYAQAEATVEDSFESQGKVVASIEQAPGTGRVDQVEEITRTENVGPEQVQVPGSTGSPEGRAAEAARLLGIPQEQLTDALARQGYDQDESAATASAEAMRESTRVQIAPPQRDITP